MPEDDPQDEKLYAAAAAELDGDERDEGLWAKCFAECDGDENKAKARYLKVRVARQKVSESRGEEKQTEGKTPETQQEAPSLSPPKPSKKSEFDWTVLIALIGTLVGSTLFLDPALVGEGLFLFCLWAPFAYLFFRELQPSIRAIALSSLLILCGPISVFFFSESVADAHPLKSLVVVGATVLPPIAAIIMIAMGAHREVNMGGSKDSNQTSKS